MAASPCRGHSCAVCCYETEMPLLEEDVRRLAALGHARDAFSTVDENGILTLKNVDNAVEGGKRHCYFLKADLCSVYADRPMGCRLYPFVLDDTAKRVVRDEDCPHRREFKQDPGIGRRLIVTWTQVSREAAARRK